MYLKSRQNLIIAKGKIIYLCHHMFFLCSCIRLQYCFLYIGVHLSLFCVHFLSKSSSHRIVVRLCREPLTVKAASTIHPRLRRKFNLRLDRAGCFNCGWFRAWKIEVLLASILCNMYIQVRLFVNMLRIFQLPDFCAWFCLLCYGENGVDT